MKREYRRWHSPRLGIELGVVVYGHWGPPLMGFPTSAGDEWELEGQSMVGSLADFIDAGRVKLFTVNSINGLSFYNKGAHPFHRSYVQSVFDSYLREEVVPFIWDNCQSRIAITTMGSSFGAYHAANIAFRHPDTVSNLISLSGSFDISDFFDGYYDDNIYFNSPFHYLPNTTDPWKYNHMGIIIGTGEWDNTRHESYRLSEILNSKGIQHWLDDGKWRGHDWNYWRDMLPYYLSKIT